MVLELLDRGGYGQELPVEGGVSGLGVGKSTAEEGEWLEPPLMVLMDKVMSRRGWTSTVALEMAVH